MKNFSNFSHQNNTNLIPYNGTSKKPPKETVITVEKPKVSFVPDSDSGITGLFAFNNPRLGLKTVCFQTVCSGTQKTSYSHQFLQSLIQNKKVVSKILLLGISLSIFNRLLYWVPFQGANATDFQILCAFCFIRDAYHDKR